MPSPAPFLLRWFAYLAFAGSVAAADVFFKPGDVVAFAGGEDLTALAEQGHLECLLLRAFPELRLTFRNLAHEGDTVFQQQRDLNYPPVEQQLDQVGATVVIAQFGLMESLAGNSKLTEFSSALEGLLDRLSANGKRRVVLLGPGPISPTSPAQTRFQALELYVTAVRRAAQRRELRCLFPGDSGGALAAHYRDGVHLNEFGLTLLARQTAQMLGGSRVTAIITGRDDVRLTELVRQKNQLWVHYDRPQNWAFLNGDRTVQPSSRDHRDPSIRWFPEEMKQWLPLIEAQEREIWQLAARQGTK